MARNSYQNLHAFIQALEMEGELLRIKAPVSPDLEISCITDLVSKSSGGGKALLFENVTGSRFPVITNQFGSFKRICMALGAADLDELALRMKSFLELEPARSIRRALRLIRTGKEVLNFFPKKVKRAPCQEVVHTGAGVDLSNIPVLKCWPQDGGPFITLPLVVTRSLITGKQNVGMYRLQVYDKNTTGMHWHIHKDGAHYFREYRKAKKRMPVAVAIGTDPATTYAATAPLPPGLSEFMLSGFLRRSRVPVVKCITNDLYVPAEAEFVLEGYVDPDETRIEGPFGDHTGYYSLEDEYPVFHIAAITHRRNPVYATTIVGKPPMEDCYLAKATERIFLPLLQQTLPEIYDYWLPWEGVFHNLIIVSINKEYPGHAAKVMNALWGLGQMSFCKGIVVVPNNISLKDGTGVLRHILNTVDLDRDILISHGILDVLDHSSPQPLFGGKLGVDCTGVALQSIPCKLPLGQEIEEALRNVSDGLGSFRVLDLNTRLCPIFIHLHKDGTLTGRSIAHKLMNHNVLEPFSIFIAFDPDVDLANDSVVLWKVCNNVDPKRDIVLHKGRIFIDATKKGPEDGYNRPWPDEIIMEPEVVERVKKRAKELGIKEFLDN